MAGLGDLVLAYLLSSGAHTGGHFVEANNQDVSMRLNPSAMTEVWDTPDTEKASQIHGAGFKYQGLLSNALTGSRLEQPYRGATGLYKLAYVAGLPNMLSGNAITGGDIGGMEQTTGNKQISPLLALSALVDLYKAKNPNPKWDLGFWQNSNGTPGLEATWKW